MKRGIARLERMERDIAQQRLRNRQSMRHIFQALADPNPDLALVEPCDTDPVTYRRITINQSMLRGDWATFDRLQAEERAEEERERPLRPLPQPTVPGGPTGALDDLLGPEGDERMKRELKLQERAVAAAKKRLAKANRRPRPQPVPDLGEDEL